MDSYPIDSLTTKARRVRLFLIVDFVFLYLNVFAACANFLGDLSPRRQDITRAKSPRRQVKSVVISTSGRNLS